MKLSFYLKIFLVIFLAIFLVLLHLTLISFYTSPLNHLNLFIPFFIFFFLLTDQRLVWYLAFFSAWFLDILSFNFFGLHIITFLLIVWLIDAWLKNWFTRHSIYSFLVLGVLATLLRNFIFYGLSFNKYYLFFRQEFWFDLLVEIIGVIIFILLFYYLAFNFSRRLKPFFLGRKPLS
jgi:hypothetical protein